MGLFGEGRSSIHRVGVPLAEVWWAEGAWEPSGGGQYSQSGGSMGVRSGELRGLGSHLVGGSAPAELGFLCLLSEGLGCGWGHGVP